jgi:DNA replication protein DnaC
MDTLKKISDIKNLTELEKTIKVKIKSYKKLIIDLKDLFDNSSNENLKKALLEKIEFFESLIIEETFKTKKK